MKIALPIAQPPWSQRGKKIESLIRKACYDFALLPEEETKIGVALSGGKDSLTLLFMLHALSGRGFANFKLFAFHVGGEFSCGSGIGENFLQSICQELNIPLITRTSTQKKETLACYRCSRERRRLIFEAAKSVGVNRVAFGHHRDDNAQTLLMNLFHKAEFAGNLPSLEMIDFAITIIRPLIYVPESEITHFAKEHGFARITCQCPVGANSMRKKVDRLLAEIEELFPNSRSNIADASLIYGSQKARKK